MIPEPRARAMMPRAARPSSNTKYSRRRPQRRDALFRRLALTTKAFFKTEDKRARQREVRGEYKRKRGCSEVVLGAGNILKSRASALETKESATMTRRMCWMKALSGGDANDIVVFTTTLVDESAGCGFSLSVPGIFSFLFFFLMPLFLDDETFRTTV